MRCLLLALVLLAAPLSAQDVAWEQVYATDRIPSMTVLSSGTVLAGIRAGSSYTPSVLRSTDSGATWVTSSDDVFSSYSLAALPSGAALVAGYGGVYRSEDDGQTWTLVRPSLLDHPSCLLDSWWTLATVRRDGSVFLGAVTSTGLPSRGAASGCGYHGGMQYSSDGTAPWTPASATPTPLAFAEMPDGTLWIGGRNGYGYSPRSLSYSTDGGLTWEAPEALNDRLIRALFVTENGDLLAGAGPSAEPSPLPNSAAVPVSAPSASRGLFHSTNNLSWNSVGGPLAALEIFVLEADGLGRIYAGTSGGVFRSMDSGASWAAINTGLPPTSRVTALDVTPDGYLVAGVEGRGLYRSETSLTAAGGDNPALPSALALRSAYPNPFTSTTTLAFDLPAATYVSLTVFDVLGRRIATLIEGRRMAGVHEVTWTADGLPSGIYVARLGAGGTAQTRRLVLAR